MSAPDIDAGKSVQAEIPNGFRDSSDGLSALLVRCLWPMSSGPVRIIFRDDQPDALVRSTEGVVEGGELFFFAPAAGGEASWEVKGFGWGTVSWKPGATGGAISCDRVEVAGRSMLVHGHVLESDGTPATQVLIDGCSGKFLSSASDGRFGLEISGGKCSVRAMRTSGAEVSYGPPVIVDFWPGASFVDLELLAPPNPAPQGTAPRYDAREPTPP